MIDQTIPFPQLTDGLARCVREWILPHLDDPMAKTQAELLATLIEGLPDAWGPAAGTAIRGDSAVARDLLATHGVSAARAPSEATASIDDLMRENAELKSQLQALADRLRADGDATRTDLEALQRFFVASAANDVRIAAGEGTDFASISSKEGASKRR